MPQNKAAWLVGKQVTPLEVKEAPYPSPAEDQVVIKNHYVAVNPVDWKVQKGGYIVTKFPNILGEDVAGEVEEVGKNVTDLKRGDRVLAHMLGLGTTKPEDGGFQLYSLASAVATAKIPDSVKFDEASVLPLALSTAAAGLYQPSHLGLSLPSTSPKSNGQTLLVWGGSSSVGITTIQLAKASGFQVATTVSSRNFDLVKSAGADYVFDYNEKNVVDEIIKALSGKELAGAYDAISTGGTVEQVAQVLSKVESKSNKKFIATVLPPPENLPEGVKAAAVFAVSIFGGENASVGKGVWQDYVPAALASGQLKPLPTPLEVGQGLDKVQAGLDKQQAGVSAQKVVVKLV